jgi:hypothetical protein
VSADRELLNLAAKAAGIKINAARQAERDEAGFDDVGLWTDTATNWNPLADDGDRLRLIRALKMNIDYADCGVSARYNFGRNLAQEWWGGDEGDEAHAVLRVAAEIGKAML